MLFLEFFIQFFGLPNVYFMDKTGDGTLLSDHPPCANFNNAENDFNFICDFSESNFG